MALLGPLGLRESGARCLRDRAHKAHLGLSLCEPHRRPVRRLISVCVWRVCVESVGWMEQLATPTLGHAAAIVVVILSLFYLTTERLRDTYIYTYWSLAAGQLEF